MANFAYDDGKGFRIDVSGTVGQVLGVQELLLNNSNNKNKADIMFDTLFDCRKFEVGDKVRFHSKSAGFSSELSPIFKEYYREHGYLIIKHIADNGDIVLGIKENSIGDYFLESDLEHYKGE